MAGALVLGGGSLRPESVVTDSAGRFRVAGLAHGSHGFSVRRIGYTPAEFEVEFVRDTVLELDVPLEMSVTTLDTITIRGGPGAYERKLRFVGFEERRQAALRSATDATFITPEDIDRRRPFRLSHLLEGQRSVKIGYAAQGLIAVPFGRDGRCVMSVWVDGQEMRNLFPAGSISNSGAATFGRDPPPPSVNPGAHPGLDLVAASDIAAVEIYPSPSGTPPQFQNLTGNCGAIVIWTKQ